MMVMPGMAVVFSVMAMMCVTMDLNILLSVRVDLRMMVVMKPGTPPDLLKIGMQHHGHLQHVKMSHFLMSPV